jgi:NAD(P)-dependent dehydrogenase (short-subunit alcohol dehydrogenase family)
MDLGLAGKTVIVTGGGSNIGRGIVLAFAKEGSNIVNAELDERQGQKVVNEANSLGGQAILAKTDVTDWDSVQAMVKKTLKRFGKIDVLVNNVGGATGASLFVEKPREECEKEISLNFWSVVNCIKAVAGHMIERRYGKIVNIGSVSGQSGLAGSNVSLYGGAKGAVMSLSKALAWELGGYGINVNVVCPGMTLPETLENVGEKSVWKKWAWNVYTPELREAAAKSVPLQRLGSAQDIANMVVFLASDCASYVTGQTISVSGGQTMW